MALQLGVVVWGWCSSMLCPLTSQPVPCNQVRFLLYPSEWYSLMNNFCYNLRDFTKILIVDLTKTTNGFQLLLTEVPNSLNWHKRSIYFMWTLNAFLDISFIFKKNSALFLMLYLNVYLYGFYSTIYSVCVFQFRHLFFFCSLILCLSSIL